MLKWGHQIKKGSIIKIKFKINFITNSKGNEVENVKFSIIGEMSKNMKGISMTLFHGEN